MADVIKEYAIEISVKGSKAVIKEFKELNTQETKQNKQLKETNSLLWTYAKRLVGIYAIYKMINKGISLAVTFAEQGNALKTMSSMANVSTVSLQKWGNALKRIGGDGKAVASTMASINQKIFNKRNFGTDEFRDLIIGYGAGEYLQSKNAEDFLIAIAKKMEGYNDMAKNDILMKAGITDPTLGRFLKGGEKYVKSQLAQAQALFSSEDIKKAEEATKAFADFNIQLEKFANTIGGIVLEPLTNVIKELTDFLKDPKSYIAKAFSEGSANKPSAYGVAKDMFSLNQAGQWGLKRLLGLTDFSATTGKDKYLEGVDKLSRNIFGKDYDNAMSVLSGAGVGLYEGAGGELLQKGLSMRNDISVNIGSSIEEPIETAIHKEFGDIADKVIALYKQTLGSK